MADASASAPAQAHRRIAARELLTEGQLAGLRERSLWRGLWLIAHAWIVIFGSIALLAWWPNPLTFLVAVVLIGSRQLGLAILMHDAAHAAIHSNLKVNDWAATWLCGAPVGASLKRYRPIT
jgi:fatty acid desaturase